MDRPAREIELRTPMSLMRSEFPEQQVMSFQDCEGVVVQQETNLCCRCCCCQPNINYRMQPFSEAYEYRAGDQLDAVWYLAEDADFLARCISCCYPGARKTLWTVHNGSSTADPVLMTHSKNWTCSHCPAVCIGDGGEIVRVPCCCFLPYLTTRDAEGRELGTTRYACDQWLFVPKFDVFDAEGNHVYRIRPNTCCLGCCVKCNCGGGQQRRGKFRVPHPIRHPYPPYDQIGDADILDLWAGFVRQVCTKQETLALKFPVVEEAQDTFARKATLLGATVLLNTLLYDHE